MSVATLYDIVEARSSERRQVLHAVLSMVLGSLVIAAAAQAQLWIPGLPAPITLQTLAVIGLGIALGPRLGAGAAALYVLECIAMPGFSATGRILVSGGFLLGFIPAAFLAGELYRRGFGRTLTRALVAAISANLVILTLGALWLGAVTGWYEAVELVFVKYLVIDLAKIAACALLMRGLDGAALSLARRAR